MRHIPKSLLIATALVLASASASHADWGASADSLQLGTPGETGQVTCPAGGQPGTIWGTGTYTSDSSICTAALHYGWITPGVAAEVTFRVVAGLDGYEGSTANGITSQPYGAWSRSFQIIGAAVPETETEAAPKTPGAGAGTGATDAETIIWRHSPESLGIHQAVGQSFAYHCEGGAQEVAVVIGSGPYSQVTSICLAAVHAGLITYQSGGTVTVTIGGPVEVYGSNPANGIAPMGIPYSGNSFIVN